MPLKSILYTATLLASGIAIVKADVTQADVPLTNKSGLYADKQTPTRESDLFDRIDMDRDGKISQPEMVDYHMSAIVDVSLDEYEYVEDARIGEMTAAFEQLDKSQDGKLTRAEFVGISDMLEWYRERPVAYTVDYFVRLVRMDVDDLEGRAVDNLQGEDIGTIETIIAHKTDGQMYAMIDLSGTPLYRLGELPVDKVGIKLVDMMFMENDDAIVLTTKAEHDIRDLKQVEIDMNDFEEVKSLYRIGR